MKNKTPLFHISRRKSIVWYKAWAIRAVAIILALVLCGIITMMTTGLNPVRVYTTMIDGAFGSARKLWMLFQNIHVVWQSVI